MHSHRSPVTLAGRGKTRRVQSGRVQAEYPSRTRPPELGPEMRIGKTSLAAPTQRHCWFLPDQSDGAGLQHAGSTHLQTRPRPGPLAECCPNYLNTNISHVLLYYLHGLVIHHLVTYTICLVRQRISPTDAGAPNTSAGIGRPAVCHDPFPIHLGLLAAPTACSLFRPASPRITWSLHSYNQGPNKLCT
jgi:hypothetical protein